MESGPVRSSRQRKCHGIQRPVVRHIFLFFFFGVLSVLEHLLEPLILDLQFATGRVHFHSPRRLSLLLRVHFCSGFGFRHHSRLHCAAGRNNRWTSSSRFFRWFHIAPEFGRRRVPFA